MSIFVFFKDHATCITWGTAAALAAQTVGGAEEARERACCFFLCNGEVFFCARERACC